MKTGHVRLGVQASCALVLSHAGFLDCRMWDEQWDALCDTYRVIRYDMAGFGKSAPVTSPRARRDDLYRLLRHLQVDRAHLLGCSIGGEIVLDLALESSMASLHWKVSGGVKRSLSF